MAMLVNLDSRDRSLSKAIRRIVHEEMENYFILITGKVQSRKSTLAIALAMRLQDDFDIATQMAILKGADYIRALNNPNLKRGDVVVLDEIQAGLNHREWFSFINKALNSIMATHGYRGLIVIVTTPYVKYVDDDTKALFNMWIKTLRKNDAEQWVRAKVYTLDPREYIDSQRGKKVKILTVRPINMHNTKQAIKWFNFRYPPDEVMQTYWPIAEEAKSANISRLEEQAMKMDKAARTESFNAVKEAAAIAELVRAGDHSFIVKVGNNAYVNIPAIRNHCGIGNTRARDVKKALEGELREWLVEYAHGPYPADYGGVHNATRSPKP